MIDLKHHPTTVVKADRFSNVSLNIPDGTENAVIQVENTKRPYQGGEDYANAHGAPWSFYQQAGWIFDYKHNRPALRFETQTGPRWRFIDGDQNKRPYHSPKGYKNSWYRLDEALKIAEETGHPLVLTNGEASTVTAQYWRVAATAMTGGEKTSIPSLQLEELRLKYAGPIIVAFDCDAAGQMSKFGVARQLLDMGLDAIAVDLGLSDGGDLADFCSIYKMQAATSLSELEAINIPEETAKPKRQRTDMPRYHADGEYADAIRRIKEDEIPHRLGLTDTRTNGDGFTVQRVANPFYPHEHDDRSPASVYNFETGVFYDHKGGHTYRLKELCELLNIEWPRQKAKRPSNMQRRSESPIGDYPMNQWANPVKLPSFTADIQVNLRYISELALEHFYYKTLLVRSPLNTGKTTLFEKILANFEKQHGKQARVLVITHGQALTDDIARRLSLYSYRDIPADQPELAKSLDRVVSSYDSLWLFEGCEFDIIFIDETEAFHPHIGSGTMSGREAQRNYKTLKSLLKSAGQVVAADAHMSNLSRNWFEKIRGEVIGIENTYRHKWGKLTITKDMAHTISKALKKAEQNVGPVVIPTNSRTLSEQLRIIFEEAIGTGVRVINGWNSANKENQAFIRNINEELAKTRVLIVSPAIADGTDVQTAVAGVYGVFTRNMWGSASSILQQMMRYRNASERYLYVQPTFDGTEETDWKAIYLRFMRQIEGTAKAANFDAHALETSNEIQRAILRLTSEFQAQRAKQRNNIFSFVVAFAKDEGFDIAYDETENKLIRERLKQAREQLSEEQEEKTLTLDPISPDEFDDIRRKGLVTHDDNYALIRYKIEYTAGQDITPELYNLLKTSQNRADFNRFCDLFENETKLQDKDRAQADASELIARRRHYTRNMQLITGVMQSTFGGNWLHKQVQLTESEIVERLQPYLGQHFHEIETYVDTRKGLSSDPLNVLRRMAKRGGMKLSSKQVMVKGERFYVYWLDEEHLDRMHKLAKLALEARRKREAEKQPQLLNSVSTSNKYTNLSNQKIVSPSFDASEGIRVTLSTGEEIAIPF